MDPLLLNTEQMIGSNIDMNDESSSDIGRNANKARMDLLNSTGIDAALGSLSITSSSGIPITTITKVTYKDFEERMLPIIKAENPGLRLSQYKEKVYNLWKKSPENPANQIIS